MAELFEYFIFYKPYDVLPQFTRERPEHKTLADFLKVKDDIYPVGRLDKDSEGLMILTNDKSVNGLLLLPGQKKEKTYLVQVEGEITSQAISSLQTGVEIKLEDKMYLTRSCKVKKLSKTPVLPERNPPIRFRLNKPTSWIMIVLEEGKNRQIRKMCSKVGFPVLRLVRVQIGNITLGKLLPGQSKKMTKEDLFELLSLSTIPKKVIANKAPLTDKGKKSHRISVSKKQGNSKTKLKR
jgi:23S rRNA pseudouridine2457 synthase